VRPPVLLSWSGGKDAAWTLYRLRAAGDVEVVGLLATLDADARASMQGVRASVLQAQARAAGLPLLEAPLPPAASNASYEQGMAAALDEAARRWPGLETLATGDLLLEDLRAWREASLSRLGWRLCTPLFGEDTAALATGMLHGGLRASLCCVDTQQLDAAFAGRGFDAALLQALPDGIDACGEHGEFHTCVYAGPMFGAPLPLARGDTWLRDGRFAITDFALAAAGD